jgi:hypothetical protein
MTLHSSFLLNHGQSAGSAADIHPSAARHEKRPESVLLSSLFFKIMLPLF